MGLVEEYLPAMAMFGLQVTYAIMALLSRAALLKGMSPRVFVVYRQAIATLFIAPIAYFSRPKSRRLSLDLKSFSLIFLAALVGATMNQNVYFEGVFLAGSSMATAMTNLIPAVTFVIATMVGMESLKMRSLRSMAKIGGTVICVSGAMCMALLRGPKLLNSSLGFGMKSSIFSVESGSPHAWLLGSLCVFGSSCCWSIWLILQSIIVTLLVEPMKVETWKIHSTMEVICYLFSGIVGSGIAFFLQAWCVSKRGPVFSAMFNPLCTIVTTILAAIVLHEEIFTGSLVAGVAVIIGLYIVLWGKAKDYVKEEHGGKGAVEKEEEDCESASTDRSSSKIGLEEPLLFEGATHHIDS
ncbi:WAT1-related protein At4g30420-like isoform X2 [Cucurbita moschata]|uniref:WAT1-related protein n=1 Tax=Cucurbita moschata TaxID=3662 RepID=A0A6J1ET00_CUCMO|nr:WAT1-related protein At4g30420-like isoform X2 [Cucurbita moschata]